MWFRNFLNADPKTRPARNETKPGTPAFNGLSGQNLRALNHLVLNTGPLLQGMPTGMRASPMRKPAAEFRDHRSYVPGDDVRFVDWKASARQEHIFIKQGEQQKAAVVYVLLDCSASMAWGSPPKFLAALQLANALGYLALGNGDRLVVMPVTGMRQARPSNDWLADTTWATGQSRADSASSMSQRPPSVLHPLGPLSGKGQAPLLTGYLQALRFNGQVSIPTALLQLSRRGISNGGLVIVISDLFGADDLARGLDALPPPAWRVVLLHLLHPAELNPQLDGYLEMQDIETSRRKRVTVNSKALELYHQKLDAWLEELDRRSAEKKAIYTRVAAGESLEQEIIPRLRRARVVRPL